MIFSNNLYKNFSLQDLVFKILKKPVEKLSFSDFAGLKPVTLLKRMNSL